MDKKKFLQQVYSKIKEKGIPQAEIKEDCINILSDDVVIFKIDSKGGMFYSSDKKIANLVDELHDKIQPIVTDVGEYLKAMETALELKARDFNMAYRTLVEFNDTVLFVTPEPISAPDEFEITGGVIEEIDEDKKSCRMHSTFTHIDVPFKYILARHNKKSFDSYCGWKNAEIILDARASDGKVLLDEAKEIYFASQIENNEDMKMEM